MTDRTILDSLRAHCMTKPNVTEDYPWGETTWKVKGKIFASWAGEPHCCCGVKSTLEKQAALIQHPAISVAKYVGRYGWVTIVIRDGETLELALELIDESYEMVIGPKKKKV